MVRYRMRSPSEHPHQGAGKDDGHEEQVQGQGLSPERVEDYGRTHRGYHHHRRRCSRRRRRSCRRRRRSCRHRRRHRRGCRRSRRRRCRCRRCRRYH
ncbi:Prm2 [Lemmus lemmus]